MSPEEIATCRLDNQLLAGNPLRSAAETVEWFAAVQGQEYAQTKWGLGIRLPELTDADIEAEIDRGTIIRTHILRPTWHLVHARDLKWMLALSAPRVHTVNGTMYRQLELDRATLRKACDVIVEALSGNNHLTRAEIGKILASKGIQSIGHRLAYIMMFAELEGLVCSGRRRGNQFTYALLEERIPPQPSRDKEEALALFTQRYLQSRGPATMYDFATWSGLTLAECRLGIDLMDRRPEVFSISGLDHYHYPVAIVENNRRQLHLLPEYDELLMGYKNREVYFQKVDFQKTVMRHNCLILNGTQAVGTFKRLIKGRKAIFHVDFFGRPTKKQLEGLDKQLRFFEKFSGLEVEMV
jgi:hypothetical protein